MVDRYWRKIEDVENNIENAMQISSILLKLKENDKKLEGLSKIGDNENNISSNLSKIGDNENNISSNLSKIGDNVNNITSNLSKIEDNENNISSNLSKIGDNENNISSNLSKIGDNENNISSNLTKIDNFTQYILKSGKDFEEKYIIKKQIFRFNKDKHFYTIFEKEIEYNFTENSLLIVKNNMYYKYDNLSNDYFRLQHEYNIYDGDNLIHKYLFNKDTYYDENLDPILHTNEDFCICFKKNYQKIKLNLLLHRHNRYGIGNIDLKIDDNNENYINIDYLDRNDENIEKNKNNISTNLIKINSNEDDIAYNLSEINYLKNNKSTQYLKNVYNILFYNKKTQIDFRNNFYNKTFELNANKNDFIEINLRMLLDYENINESHLVFTASKLINDDDEIYISTYHNKDKILYKNFVFISETIFYNFEKDTKKLKILIYFRKADTNAVIKFWYKPINTDRLIIKHFSN